MALRDRIEYLRREHDELLHLANSIEKALESAAKDGFTEHLKSITELRGLEHGINGIAEHCRAENRIVESTYHHFLDKEDRERIDLEHQGILRCVTNFREELRFATADRTKEMIPLGMDVISRLRIHIAYERRMLDRIVKGGVTAKRIGKKSKTGRTTLRAKVKHASKQKMRVKEAMEPLPYTLETHPELF